MVNFRALGLAHSGLLHESSYPTHYVLHQHTNISELGTDSEQAWCGITGISRCPFVPFPYRRLSPLHRLIKMPPLPPKHATTRGVSNLFSNRYYMNSSLTEGLVDQRIFSFIRHSRHQSLPHTSRSRPVAKWAVASWHLRITQLSAYSTNIYQRCRCPAISLGLRMWVYSVVYVYGIRYEHWLTGFL